MDRWISLCHFVFAVPPDHTTSTMPQKGSKRLPQTKSSKHAAAPPSLTPPPAEVNSYSEEDSIPLNVHVSEAVSRLQQKKQKKRKQRQQKERAASPADTVELESTQDDAAVSQALQASQSRKFKSRAVFLTREQEQGIADWYKDREWFYNFRCEGYKDTVRKNKALEEKAAQLGYSGTDLKTWIKSKKDLAAKILKQKTSGAAAKPMTDREHWVYDNFRHAAGFAKRVAEHKRKKGEQLPSRKLPVLEATNEPSQLQTSQDDVGAVSDVPSSKAGSHATESISAASDTVSVNLMNFICYSVAVHYSG